MLMNKTLPAPIAPASSPNITDCKASPDTPSAAPAVPAVPFKCASEVTLDNFGRVWNSREAI